MHLCKFHLLRSGGFIANLDLKKAHLKEVIKVIFSYMHRASYGSFRIPLVCLKKKDRGQLKKTNIPLTLYLTNHELRYCFV